MILGTAGHVDHGKTTLVRALTGVDCDRLDEERRRGITIQLGFAPWTLPDGRRLSVVDVPGHERLVRTMLVGAGGMELVLLVVSAEAGVMPQTREHLGACQVLGVRAGVVALTFADRVADPAVAAERIRGELAGTFLAEAPIVPVCAPEGRGLEALGEAVAAVAGETSGADLLPCLPVDRAFAIPGFGTVVTGSLWRGRLEVGQLVSLHPGQSGLRIRGLQIHGESVQIAPPGHRVAVNLPDLDRERLDAGAWLGAPEGLVTTRVLDVEFEWLGHNPRPLRRLRGVTLHLGAMRALANLRADAPIEPGQRGTGRVHLDRPLPIPPGAGFVLRGNPTIDFGAVRGGGRVLDTQPPRRRLASVRARLAAEPAALDALLEDAGPKGVLPDTVALRIPVPPLPAGPPLFSDRAEGAAIEALVSKVTEHHRLRPLEPGLPRSQTQRTALEARARGLAVEQGVLLMEAGILRSPTHRASLEGKALALSRKLMRAIGKAGLAALSEKALFERFPAPNAEIKEVLEHLIRAERIIRHGGFYFPAREAKALRSDAAREALDGARLSIGWLKERAGVSRKHAIPLFNWLDHCGATARAGDQRVAGSRAADYLS